MPNTHEFGRILTIRSDISMLPHSDRNNSNGNRSYTGGNMPRSQKQRSATLPVDRFRCSNSALPVIGSGSDFRQFLTSESCSTPKTTPGVPLRRRFAESVSRSPIRSESAIGPDISMGKSRILKIPTPIDPAPPKTFWLASFDGVWGHLDQSPPQKLKNVKNRHFWPNRYHFGPPYHRNLTIYPPTIIYGWTRHDPEISGPLLVF